MGAPSRLQRANQWLQFARVWHVVDANHQDAKELGKKVAKYLLGKHKPFWHPETDCGDHVVVYNCRHVAMHAFDWKHTLYHFNKEYPKSKVDIPAHEIHEYDPCRIMSMTVYKGLGNHLLRRKVIERLHLFPEDEMPEFVKRNIGNQLEQIQPIPKKSTDYTAEERANFPRLYRLPENHIIDWHDPLDPPTVNP